MTSAVPLKSKLPVESRFLYDANHVARDANHVARDANRVARDANA